jgi:hypothetical protein
MYVSDHGYVRTWGCSDQSFVLAAGVKRLWLAGGLVTRESRCGARSRTQDGTRLRLSRGPDHVQGTLHTCLASDRTNVSIGLGRRTGSSATEAEGLRSLRPAQGLRAIAVTGRETVRPCECAAFFPIENGARGESTGVWDGAHVPEGAAAEAAVAVFYRGPASGGAAFGVESPLPIRVQRPSCFSHLVPLHIQERLSSVHLQHVRTHQRHLQLRQRQGRARCDAFVQRTLL